MHNPLLPQTIERISQAQVSVTLPIKRQNEIALEVAEQAEKFACDTGNIYFWIRAWRRAEEVRSQMAGLS